MNDPEDYQAPRTPRDFRHFQSLIDQLVGEARSAGHFDQLPGEGKPLRNDDDLLVPQDDRLAYRMLKSHGFAPPWIETRRDILADRAHLEEWLERTNTQWTRTPQALQRKAREEYREKLSELRSRILSYNLSVPPAVGQMELIDLKKELERLGRH